MQVIFLVRFVFVTFKVFNKRMKFKKDQSDSSVLFHRIKLAFCQAQNFEETCVLQRIKAVTNVKV